MESSQVSEVKSQAYKNIFPQVESLQDKNRIKICLNDQDP